MNGTHTELNRFIKITGQCRLSLPVAGSIARDALEFINQTSGQEVTNKNALIKYSPCNIL